MSNDIMQIAMTSYYDRTKYAAIPEGMKAAINAVFPIQENYFIEEYYNIIFSDDNNIVNELHNYLEDRDIQINRIDEDNKHLLKENEKLREALKDCEKEIRSIVSYIRNAPNTKWDRNSGILLEILRKADAARAALEGVTEKEGSGNE